MALEIEIFSDVICPWCFIGKRRLDAALLELQLDDVNLRWRAYQLYPNLPADGIDRRELLKQRYGEDADPGRVPGRIKEEAGAEGIELRFDLIERTPNTLLAHCLLEYAAEQGVQHEVAESLFRAYFCEGKDVGKLATLIEVGAASGLESDATEAYLVQQRGLEQVRADLARAPEIGVSGVPGYWLADSFLLPGAQSSETMGQIIGRVRDRLIDRA